MLNRFTAVSRVVTAAQHLQRLVGTSDGPEGYAELRALQGLHAAIEDYEQATARATRKARGEPETEPVHIRIKDEILCGIPLVDSSVHPREQTTRPPSFTNALGARAGDATCNACLDEWDAMK